MNYAEFNRRAYDSLAPHYLSKQSNPQVRKLFLRLTKPLIRLLKERFEMPRVLDIGCGSGLALKIFEDQGLCTTGIDISEKMIEAAFRLSPRTRYICGDFIRANLKPRSYEGVFAKSVMYLFPKEDSLKFIQKVKGVLVPNGIAHISISISDVSREGILPREKSEDQRLRFKREWTEEELLETLKSQGCDVFYVKRYANERDRGINLMFNN